MSDTIMVIGGGIAGIQAALDLANAGAKVVMVEKAPSIGGKMAVLDKNFPTLDCSICIEAPKMSEVDLHPNIEILSLSQVESLEGEPGNFRVRIRQKARYVTSECTRCNLCTLVCPVVLPNEFDSGMAARKAIYTPIPQAVPGPYLIDMEHCLNSPPNYLPCNHCSSVCGPAAIDFFMQPEQIHERTVGAVIVATGYDTIDPHALREFGYGRHPDILTGMEFERLLTSAGPTQGEIVRPSNGEHPHNLLLVLCVGSRDRRFVRYCSRFCCMYSLKHAYQAVDHGIQDVTIMYMDIRAYGKGFDEFRQRVRDGKVRFIRSRPAEIRPGTDNRIHVRYEDTADGHIKNDEYDLVVLANAVVPSAGSAELARRLGIEIDEDGFFKVTESRGGMIASTRPGIFIAGCASGPKDIPDSVAQGSGAAGASLRYLSHRTWPEPCAVETKVDLERPRIGVFVCHCGSNIAGVVDVEHVAKAALTLPDVVFSSHQMFSCAGNTQKEIEEAIRRENVNRVVVAACSPRTHESIFRGVLQRAGLNPYLLVMANIRNLNSWVHKESPQEATEKALDMIWMAVEHARRLQPLTPSILPLSQSCLVIGGGVAGMTAAIAMAHQGFETFLVEKNKELGGLLNELDEIAPNGHKAKPIIEELHKQLIQSGVFLFKGVTVEQIGGFVGNFEARLTNGQELKVGAVIIATGAVPYRTIEFGYGQNTKVLTNLEVEKALSNGGISGDHVTYIGCVGSRFGDKGCSRYCCTSMIHQALRLRRQVKNVRVLYKDIRTYSRMAEELYEQAQHEGVLFFRYDPDSDPQDSVQFDGRSVEFFDTLSHTNIRLPTDTLVLAIGLYPPQDNLSEQLKLSRSNDGFFMELHPKLGPVETATSGIFLAGAAQGPKDVRESMDQGYAAAAKAGALLARGVIEKEPLTVHLIEDRCIACMRCVKVCPYHAIEQIGPVKTGRIRINEAACMGCGTCAAECNFNALEMPYFTKEQILSQIDAALATHPEEKCLVFTCNWCSYAGADLAGIEKRQYPPSSRLIRTMCSGRFETDFIERAFELGAGAVLITGCRLTETGSDCHYNQANRQTWKRYQFWKRMFEKKGVAPERLQLQWISAAEGKEFAAKLKEMDQIVREYAAGLHTESNYEDSLVEGQQEGTHVS